MATIINLKQTPRASSLLLSNFPIQTNNDLTFIFSLFSNNDPKHSLSCYWNLIESYFDIGISTFRKHEIKTLAIGHHYTLVRPNDMRSLLISIFFSVYSFGYDLFDFYWFSTSCLRSQVLISFIFNWDHKNKNPQIKCWSKWTFIAMISFGIDCL